MNITALKGIGEKTARLFAKLNIMTTEELVQYYPRDYEQFKEPILLREAEQEELVSVPGVVRGNIATRHVRNLSITTFSADCDGEKLSLTYFNMPYLKNTIKLGQRYIFRGYLQKKGNHYGMEQAQLYKPEEYAGLIDYMQPRYSTTRGLSNKTITKAVKQAIAMVDLSEDFLPEEIVKAHKEGIIHFHEPVSHDSGCPDRTAAGGFAISSDESAAESVAGNRE